MKTEKPQHKAHLQHQQTPQEPVQNLLNERPKNLIESWQHLRDMDITLAENKYSDLLAGGKPAQRQEHP